MLRRIRVSRSECKWRGYDMEKVEAALETGAPHFTVEPTNMKCPVCGVKFKMKPSAGYECCSLSCAAKMKWRRRKA